MRLFQRGRGRKVLRYDGFMGGMARQCVKSGIGTDIEPFVRKDSTFVVARQSIPGNSIRLAYIVVGKKVGFAIRRLHFEMFQLKYCCRSLCGENSLV